MEQQKDTTQTPQVPSGAPQVPVQLTPQVPSATPPAVAQAGTQPIPPVVPSGIETSPPGTPGIPPGTQQVMQPYQQGVQPLPMVKKSRWWLWVILSLGVLILIGLIAWFIFK